jgi:SAM-dependent methyltransferase
MAAPRPTVRQRLGRIALGAYDRLDARLFPEAGGPAEHWQRTVMNQVVDEHIRGLGPERLVAAEISGESHAGQPWREYHSLMFPSFDLCAPLERDGGFDVVICEQVLEHVVDPAAAAANLRGLCNPGGQVIVSTPFLIKVHELPEYAMYDYWRFTPRGLRLLLENAGLEVDDVQSWGNRQVVLGNLGRWSAHRAWHSLRNEPDIPVQVWAFAHRAGGAH